jgi:streptomycin 6-kinase
MHHHADNWGVVVDYTFETESSQIAFGSCAAGTRESQLVVLKVIKREGDEWRSGEVLKIFDGVGVARVYEHAPGAVLLERLSPGNSLAEMSLSGKDAEATEILADVIGQMSSTRNASCDCSEAVTVWDWAKGFELYVATGDDQLPKELVESARHLYLKLCASQREPRLLHGDLQHYNVLFDSERGWLAIDPKGVVGETEYEIGAILRNPIEKPDLFASRAVIERRTERLAERLGLDYGRILSWAFAQAVLSAIWDIEDGFPVDPMNPALRLADVLQPMLCGIGQSY